MSVKPDGVKGYERTLLTQVHLQLKLRLLAVDGFEHRKVVR
jgi:hypothetical protein